MKEIYLSIITPTLNNEKDIAFFLESIKKQQFKRGKIEVVIVDGGSTDKTVNIVKKYGVTLLKNPLVLADPGVDLGIRHAKGKLIMVLAADNIFRDELAIEKMVSVFDDESIIAAFPKQSSVSRDTIFTKYINTFTDPFNHFVYGYASNGRGFRKVYTTSIHTPVYDVYDFDSNADRPLIAVAQGFTVRVGFSRKKKHAFDDVIPVLELLKSHKKIAFVHSVELYHHTVRSLKHFFKKQGWASVNAIQGKKYGIAYRVNYLSKYQNLKMKVWPMYALSFIFPCIRAIYGVIVDQEILWLFHPILCMISALASVWAIGLHMVNANYKISRQ